MKATHIRFSLLVLLFLAACGPKPRVVMEPLTEADLRPAPIDPVAFFHYTNGVIAELEGDYELALHYYVSALQYAPDNYDIRVSLARLRLGMRQEGEAWKLLQPMPDIYAETVLLKADCQRVMGNWPGAIKYYELASRLDPYELTSFWYLGNYYRRSGQLEKAIENFERMSALTDNVQIFNDLAMLYLSRPDTAKAMATYEKSLLYDSSEENREAYIEFSRLLNETGRADSAMVVLSKLISRSSNALPARLQLLETYIQSGQKETALREIDSLAVANPNMPTLLGELGRYSLELNEVEKAKGFFLRQIELDQVNFMPYYFLGRIALFKNQPDSAKEYFWKAIDLADSLPDGWINLAEIYRLQDSLDLAVDILRQAQDRVTIGREEVQIYLARYFSQQEKYQAVINVLEGLVDSTTTDATVLFMLGSACERMGQYARSVALFEQLLKIAPQFHPALNYLGYMLADSGIRLPEARDMIERALAQDSLNPAYLDSYGWVLFKMGKLGEAEKHIIRALDLMEQADAVIYDHLAEIYYAQGRKQDARAIWEKALGIDPNNMAIREKLDR